MVGLLWMSDQPIAETSTYTGQHIYKHNRQTSMPRAGFQPAIPANQVAADLCLTERPSGSGTFKFTGGHKVDLNIKYTYGDLPDRQTVFPQMKKKNPFP